MFAGLVGEGDIIRKSANYTFTFEHGRLFEYRSDSWVFGKLREIMAPYADIRSVNRPLFSSRYIVVLIPKADFQFNNFLNLMINAWDEMGYGRVKLLAAETDIRSSYPGGLPGVVGEVAKGAGETIAAGIRPVIPWAILVGIAWLGFKTKKGK